jgi:phospholipase C
MNGFPEEAYAYVPHDQIQPYFDIAKQYVLAAKMFASNFDMSTFISHQYIIAGTNPGGSVNNPPAAWGCPGGPTKMDELLTNRFIKPNAVFPCWGVNTLGRELDEKNISWAYYAMPISGGQGGPSCGSGQGPDVQKGVTGIWSAYQTIKYICQGPDWNKDIISPPDRFITDVASGNLRAVTWITPRFRDSDEPGNYSDTGPSWVASVVNAIGKSKFWDSTAIFIFWDGDGGWYDPVPPPYLDDDSLGFRVPLLIVSPYAKQGYVSQVRYEHGSILKFIEDRFGLARLAQSDTRANSPATDCFDFSMPPRKFVPIKAKYPEEFFLHQPVDTRAPGAD